MPGGRRLMAFSRAGQPLPYDVVVCTTVSWGACRARRDLVRHRLPVVLRRQAPLRGRARRVRAPRRSPRDLAQLRARSVRAACARGRRRHPSRPQVRHEPRAGARHARAHDRNGRRGRARSVAPSPSPPGGADGSSSKLRHVARTSSRCSNAASAASKQLLPTSRRGQAISEPGSRPCTACSPADGCADNLRRRVAAAPRGRRPKNFSRPTMPEVLGGNDDPVAIGDVDERKRAPLFFFFFFFFPPPPFSAIVELCRPRGRQLDDQHRDQADSGRRLERAHEGGLVERSVLGASAAAPRLRARRSSTDRFRRAPAAKSASARAPGREPGRGNVEACAVRVERVGSRSRAPGRQRRTRRAPAPRCRARAARPREVAGNLSGDPFDVGLGHHEQVGHLHGPRLQELQDVTRAGWTTSATVSAGLGDLASTGRRRRLGHDVDVERRRMLAGRRVSGADACRPPAAVSG